MRFKQSDRRYKTEVDLKATVNLPTTDFPMKANLPQNEPKMLEHWQNIRIYDLVRKARAGRPQWVLHDGPPYANGAIHLGHALNKCLKDFIVKSRTMSGYDSPYIPGWDCHGLPIEIKVDEALGRKKLEMDPLEVRHACRKYAEKYVGIQSAQFQRLGVFGDFDNPYSTMNKGYEARVIENFYAFFEKGLVYKGLKPVYWCIHCRTALAEAEVEYANHTSPSVFVKYALTSDAASIDPALAAYAGKANVVIWTTTPWTLPASMAVAFHPRAEYQAILDNASGQVFILAAELAPSVMPKLKLGLEGHEVVATFPGAKLERVVFAHPFLERDVLGVLADYVTMDTGTGAVHTAPAHGADDFYTGVKYGIDQTCRVDEGGHLREGLPEYDGLTVFKANAPIKELLEKRGVLLASEDIEHSYPHCWRCHKPVIFRATEQWFISMEGKINDGTLRSEALKAIAGVKWDPTWGEERISNMVATRPDWCISRQRIWGVPIAVFFCETCGKLHENPATNKAVVDLFAREGADAWYAHTAAEIMPAGTKCAYCGGQSFHKEMDIIDVWFESGASQASVLPQIYGKWQPADMYLEGGDQYRGWFHSSLLCSMGLNGVSPYRAVATNGWTLDENGRAMSKSLGNTVDPVDIAKRMGGEIVRFWVASVDFREDVRASENLMTRVAENYRKIRNTFRYILGNLHGFEPARDLVAFDQLEPLDQYMLLRMADVAAECRAWYDEMLFHRIYQRLNEFFAVDLSAQYFDILKDRLYTYPRSSVARRSAQTALWRIGEALLRLVAPVLSFTADEAWKHMPQMLSRPESVHLALFPNTNDITGEIRDREQAEAVRADWDFLFSVRDLALRELEELRNNKTIKANLEAKVALTASGKDYQRLAQYANKLAALLVVSQVEVKQGAGGPIAVNVARAEGEKCERCWNYSTHVGEDKEWPTVCERCSANLKVIAGEAKEG
ncbi:MAG: isoleucine--tRNA ligase [Acidobacteriota bacterium]|nr:isoleucine--tRNA ligase [Acidobacteriota bacterium]